MSLTATVICALDHKLIYRGGAGKRKSDEEYASIREEWEVGLPGLTPEGASIVTASARGGRGLSGTREWLPSAPTIAQSAGENWVESSTLSLALDPT